MGLRKFFFEALHHFVCGFDIAVLLGAVGVAAAILHLLRVGADMGCRFAVDALIVKAAVIDALLESLALQNTVCMVGPCFAPSLKFFFAVPIAGFGPNPAPASSRMVRRMWTWMLRISPLRPGAWMAMSAIMPRLDELLSDKIAHQFQVLLEGQFVGKGDVERSGKLAVFAFFDFLNRIPELQTVEHPAGRIIRSVYLGMQDAAAPSVIEGFAEALILKNGASPIGG